MKMRCSQCFNGSANAVVAVVVVLAITGILVHRKKWSYVKKSVWNCILCAPYSLNCVEKSPWEHRSSVLFCLISFSFSHLLVIAV